MYLDFYGLKEKPFNPTPDPRFLYLSPSHREALAQLEYGVAERRGFLVLTGEVGTGKTTLLQTLLGRLDATTETAYVVNSTLPFDGILEYVLEDFGIPAQASMAQRLMALNRFLIDRRRAGLNTVLIIDEAQHLSPAVLEQVRLLSNFETQTEKLMQILLVGQPELRSKLELPELRQLKQRIGLRCTIGALTASEAGAYIVHRLKIAGNPFRQPGAPEPANLFSDRATRRLCEYAEGIPRTVNVVCDHCLVIGYADQKRRIERDTVEEAIRYLEGEDSPAPQAAQSGGPTSDTRRLRWAAVAALILVFGAAVAIRGLELVPDVTTVLADLARTAREIWE